MESIKEAELPNVALPSGIEQKMIQAIQKIEAAKLNPSQKLQLLLKMVDSLGIDKSQLGAMASKIRSKMESVTEGVSSAEMDKIKGAVEAANSFMGVGAELKKLGMKYTFATEPLAIYIIQPTPNNKVAIVNKRYASKPDFVVGDIAVGIMEGILKEDYDGPVVIKTGDKNTFKVGEKVTFDDKGKKREYKVVHSKGNGDFTLKLVESVNEGLWPKSKLPQSFQFALAPELKKNFKGIFYSIGDDIYHNDKKVLSVDGDRDSVNSIIAKLKKIVK
jgi:hypothetical protein